MSPKCVSCSDQLEGRLSVVRRRGNYFPKLFLKLDFLAPQISLDRLGRSTHLSLGEQLMECEVPKQTK